MLTTFVIGLREGLEAALIVGIIAAFIIRRGERSALRPMWWGVAAAVALSAGGAVALHLANRSLDFRARETMEGILALVAVGGITYMIVWMRRHSARLRGELETRTAAAITAGSVAAISGMAFIAVLREGLETAIFMLAILSNTTSPASGFAGAALGIVVSVGIGYGIYRGGVNIDLRKFFRITGVALVLVAAGLLATAVHDLAEAGHITILQRSAVDLSWLVAPGTVRSSLITAFLGFQPVPTVLEMFVWAAFLVPMTLYVLGAGRPRRARVAVLALLALFATACAPDAADAETLTVELANGHVVLGSDTMTAGLVAFETTNVSSDLVHEIEVFSGATAGVVLPVENSVALTQGLTLVDEIEDVLPGGRATLTIDLSPGTYLVVCNLPGHYEQGMWAYLEVEPADSTGS